MKQLFSRLFVFAVTLFAAVPAFAMEEAASGDSSRGTIALATAISIAVAAFGGALGQGNAVNAAMQGIARNPSASGKIMTNMIIGLALIESLVIYGLVIAFMLLGKIG
jgi:F-type H+-transporting ATPase subunit c